MNIYDIAKKAKVSTATVSRVLNNSPKVKEITKKRVEAVIESEGYTPNIFAQGLGLNSIKMVGILCTDVSDVYYSKAISIVERELFKNGLNSILLCTGDNIKGKQNAINSLLKKRVDALILIGSIFKESTDNSHIKTAAEEVPIIIINGEFDIPNTYCVVCDEEKAVEDVTTLLYEDGCEKVLFLYHTMTYSTTKKLDGYKKAVLRRFSAIDENLIRVVPKDFLSVKQMVSYLIEKENTIFDAIIACDDLTAAAAQKATISAGLNVKIIGINNSILAQCASPEITSIDNCVEMLAVAAVEVLSKLISGEAPHKTTVFEAELVERDSFRSNKIT